MIDSLKFDKISEKIVLPKMVSYFSIRKYVYEELSHNNNCVDMLSAFIKTKYFLWQEEFRDNVRGDVNGVEVTADWNFHGLYDVKKISIESFDKLIYIDFVDRFKAFINEEIDNDIKAPEIYEAIDKLKDLDSEYYVIKNLPDEYKHPWTVYEFFISGLICNKLNHEVILVEFGLD